MFDVSAWEIGLVGVVMLLILGPDRFVKMAKTSGRVYKKMRIAWRKMMSEAQDAVDDVSVDKAASDKTTSNNQDGHG